MSQAFVVTEDRSAQLFEGSVKLFETVVTETLYTELYSEDGLLDYNDPQFVEVQEVVAQLFDALEEKHIESSQLIQGESVWLEPQHQCPSYEEREALLEEMNRLSKKIELLQSQNEHYTSILDSIKHQLA